MHEPTPSVSERDRPSRGLFAAVFIAGVAIGAALLVAIIGSARMAPSGGASDPTVDLSAHFDWTVPLDIRFVRVPDIAAVRPNHFGYDETIPESVMRLPTGTPAHAALVSYLKATRFEETRRIPWNREFGPGDPIPADNPFHLAPHSRAQPWCTIVEQIQGERRVALQFVPRGRGTLVLEGVDYRHLRGPPAWEAIHLMLLCEPGEVAPDAETSGAGTP